MDFDVTRLISGGGAVAVVVLFLRHIGTTQAAVRELIAAQAADLRWHQEQMFAVVREVSAALESIRRATLAVEAAIAELRADRLRHEEPPS